MLLLEAVATATSTRQNSGVRWIRVYSQLKCPHIRLAWFLRISAAKTGLPGREGLALLS